MAIPRIMLRIVSKAGSIREFIQLFCRLCDRESIYVVTREPAEVGLKARFRINLADDRPVMQGSCEVVEVHGSKDNRYGHPGMKLRFGDLDQASVAVLERLVVANPALGHKPPLALIGELNEGSIEAIVQCRVYQEPDAEPDMAAGSMAALPGLPGGAAALPGPPGSAAALPGLAGSAAALPGPAQMDASRAANVPTEKVSALSQMPAPFVASPVAVPGAQEVHRQQVRDTTPMPAPPPAALLHDTTPFPAPPAPAPPGAFMNAGAPVMNAGAFAGVPRRGPGYVEPTQLVRPLKRPINRNAVIISAIAVVLGGVIGSYLIWGRSNSSSAAPASAASVLADGGQTAPDTSATITDCKVAIASKPDGAEVRAGDQELGTTPLQTTMPCGKAVFEISRARWQTMTHEVELVADEENHIEVELARPRVALEVVSRPEGASVIVDGKNVGKTPLTMDVAGFARTTVVVRKSGYRSYRKRFHAKPPRHTIKARLRKRRR